MVLFEFCIVCLNRNQGDWRLAVGDDVVGILLEIFAVAHGVEVVSLSVPSGFVVFVKRTVNNGFYSGLLTIGKTIDVAEEVSAVCHLIQFPAIVNVKSLFVG